MSTMMAEAPAGRPERGSSFALGFWTLPAAKRAALSDVYAFCRRADDLADDEALAPEAAREALAELRREVERVYASGAVTPLGSRLQEHLRRYPWPKEAFLGLIEAVARDLDAPRFETYAELEGYMDGAASCPGYLSIEVFGYRDGAARTYARLLGHALQMTNILRDVGEDLRRGRLYLPLEDLRRFGLDEAALKDPARRSDYEALARFEIRRARGLYSAARAALAPEDRAAMRPAEVMASVYEALLSRIEQDPAQSLRGPARLGAWAKAAAAARGWWKGGFARA